MVYILPSWVLRVTLVLFPCMYQYLKSAVIMIFCHKRFRNFMLKFDFCSFWWIENFLWRLEMSIIGSCICYLTATMPRGDKGTRLAGLHFTLLSLQCSLSSLQNVKVAQLVGSQGPGKLTDPMYSSIHCLFPTALKIFERISTSSNEDGWIKYFFLFYIRGAEKKCFWGKEIR